jgi:hypothetical protein
MTLQFICAEIERLHLQIRRQQKEVFTHQRSGIGTSLAELLLADAGFCGCAVYKTRQIAWRTAHRALCTNDCDVIH